MKKGIYLLLMLFVMTACSQTAKKPAESPAEPSMEMASENLQNVSFEVKGMTCEGCENAIVTSIHKLDGIEEASASHTGESTQVSFDASRTSVEDISQAIANAGYEVTGHELKESME